MLSVKLQGVPALNPKILTWPSRTTHGLNITHGTQGALIKIGVQNAIPARLLETASGIKYCPCAINLDLSLAPPKHRNPQPSLES